MEIYHDEDRFTKVDFKSDNSPLTLADSASNKFIDDRLKDSFPSIPIISEESQQISYNERKNWSKFWLVDPLDGTKEFIKRNGEFTVNLALIENGTPTLGLVHLPAKSITYLGSENGAFKISGDTSENICVNNKTGSITAVQSRSHSSEEEVALFEKYNVTNYTSVGSAIKFCLVAEGSADIYYRHGPTMEWDTAAGQAVVSAAGGHVYHGNSEVQQFSYNKKSLLNESFLCTGF